MMHKIHLRYGSKEFVVTVVTEKRKHLSITVHPDLRIIVKAPVGIKLEEIEKRLVKRVPWIARQIEYFERFHPLPPPHRYVSGETHVYLGRQYRLRIQHGVKPRVRLIGRFFEMELPDPKDSSKAEKVLQGWYTAHAKTLLPRRLTRFLPVFEGLGATLTEVRYRRMKRRWGSCSTKGTILLNTELIKAPIHCVDYVIVHELCHLLHPRHDKNFHRLLGRILPDWKERKERLEHVII